MPDANKLKLIALLLIVALPLTLATWMYNALEVEGVGATSNNGVLISPVLDITELGLERADGEPVFLPFEEMVAGIDVEDYEPRPWALIFLGTPTCDQACGDRLFYLRQLHRLLGPEAGRVERYYAIVSPSREEPDARTRAMFMEAFGEMQVVYSDPAILRAGLASTLPEGVDPVADHYIFVADPLGNVMMYFTPEDTPDDILEDLDRLLERSGLG